MLFVVSTIKLVAEVALLAFAGQFILGLLAGAKRESNFIWRLFDVLTKPFVRATRAITPKFVLDRHVPLAAFVMLVSVWILATLAKVNVCLQIGMERCQ
jgi:hypothetical protein